MNLRTLLIVNALVGLAAGFGLLLVPGLVAGSLGLSLDDAGTAMARLYGAELLGFNVAGWFGKDQGAGARRALVLGHSVNETATAAVLVFALASGLGNILTVGLLAVVSTFAVAFIAAALGVVMREPRHRKGL